MTFCHWQKIFILLLNIVFQGPPLRFWYGILDKYLGSNTKTAALKKVAVDQGIFAPFFLAAILGIIGLVQGNSVNDVKARISHDYPDILVNNYKVKLKHFSR